MKKVAGVVGCLLLAILFGGIGAFCAWGIVKSFQNAAATSDWVKVKADVLQAELVEGQSRRTKTYRARATYAYEYQGRKYQSSSIAVDPFGGGDNVGTWQEEMGSFLIAARAARRPITVWVNPAEPSEAFVDKEVRWGLIGLLLPFALVFGGVGIGSIYGAYKVIKRKDVLSTSYGTSKPLKVRQAEEEVTGDGPRWWLVLGWNGIAWAVAAWVAPAAIDKGNYGALLVVLLPLVGLFMLWVATKEWWRRRRLGAPKSAAARAPRQAMRRKAPGEQ